MIRHALHKLIGLRRLRENRALDEIAAREQEKLRTQHELNEAVEGLSEYETLSIEQERTKLATLLGQRLAPSELMNLQSALDASDDHRDHLQEDIERAQENFEAKSEETREARAFYWLRFRQSEKPQALADMLAAQENRKQLAVTETEDEEAYNHQTRQLSGLPRNMDASRKR